MRSYRRRREVVIVLDESLAPKISADFNDLKYIYSVIFDQCVEQQMPIDLWFEK